MSRATIVRSMTQPSRSKGLTDGPPRLRAWPGIPLRPTPLRPLQAALQHWEDVDFRNDIGSTRGVGCAMIGARRVGSTTMPGLGGPFA